MTAQDSVRQAYQVHYRRLVAQVLALTGDLAEAEDVVQEAFARVLARPRSFIDADDQQTWLRVVVFNVARTRHRRRWVFDRLVRAGRVEPALRGGEVYTDDRAPVEWLIDASIVQEAAGGKD